MSLPPQSNKENHKPPQIQGKGSIDTQPTQFISQSNNMSIAGPFHVVFNLGWWKFQNISSVREKEEEIMVKNMRAPKVPKVIFVHISKYAIGQSKLHGQACWSVLAFQGDFKRDHH